MARVTYTPNHSDESLDIDPETNQAIVTTHGPHTDDYMVLLVMVSWAIVSVIVILLLGLGYMDLVFGST